MLMDGDLVIFVNPYPLVVLVNLYEKKEYTSFFILCHRDLIDLAELKGYEGIVISDLLLQINLALLLKFLGFSISQFNLNQVSSKVGLSNFCMPKD